METSEYTESRGIDILLDKLPAQTDYWLKMVFFFILKGWSVFLISNLVIGVTDLMYLRLLRNILTFQHTQW